MIFAVNLFVYYDKNTKKSLHPQKGVNLFLEKVHSSFFYSYFKPILL